MCRIVWKSQFEQRATAARCFCSNGKYERWRDVRFRIERHEKMVVIDLVGFAEACIARKRYPIAADACVVGLLESQLKQPKPYALADDTLMTDLPPNEHIVLFRLPNGRSAGGSKRTNTYIPPLFLKRYRDAAAAVRKQEVERALRAATSETVKLGHVQTLQHLHMYGTDHPDVPSPVERVQIKGRTFRRTREHPSLALMRERYTGYVGERGRLVSWASEPKKTPADHYVCHRCMGYYPEPHFNGECPSHKVSNWIPMRDRRRPTGIPVTDRFRVPDDAPIEMIATAKYRDIDGVLWSPGQVGPLKRRRPPSPPAQQIQTERVHTDSHATDDAIAALWAEPNREAEYLYT